MTRAFSQMRERHTERGGRIYRPAITAQAFELRANTGLILLQPLNPIYDRDDRDTMQRLLEKARRKPEKSRSKRTSAAVEAGEAIFRTDTGDETQRASRGEIGGQGDG